MVKIGQFISQVKIEMKKVSWPSRPELVGSTVVVLVSILILALYVGTCDLVLSRVINFLISGVIR